MLDFFKSELRDLSIVCNLSALLWFGSFVFLFVFFFCFIFLYLTNFYSFFFVSFILYFLAFSDKINLLPWSIFASILKVNTTFPVHVRIEPISTIYFIPNFLENFHTRKLGEITVFYTVCFTQVVEWRCTKRAKPTRLQLHTRIYGKASVAPFLFTRYP